MSRTRKPERRNREAAMAALHSVFTGGRAPRQSRLRVLFYSVGAFKRTRRQRTLGFFKRRNVLARAVDCIRTARRDGLGDETFDRLGFDAYGWLYELSNDQLRDMAAALRKPQTRGKKQDRALDAMVRLVALSYAEATGERAEWSTLDTPFNRRLRAAFNAVDVAPPSRKIVRRALANAK